MLSKELYTDQRDLYAAAESFLWYPPNSIIGIPLGSMTVPALNQIATLLPKALLQLHRAKIGNLHLKKTETANEIDQHIDYLRKTQEMVDIMREARYAYAMENKTITKDDLAV